MEGCAHPKLVLSTQPSAVIALAASPAASARRVLRVVHVIRLLQQRALPRHLLRRLRRAPSGLACATFSCVAAAAGSSGDGAASPPMVRPRAASLPTSRFEEDSAAASRSRSASRPARAQRASRPRSAARRCPPPPRPLRRRLPRRLRGLAPCALDERREVVLGHRAQVGGRAAAHADDDLVRADVGTDDERRHGGRGGRTARFRRLFVQQQARRCDQLAAPSWRPHSTPPPRRLRCGSGRSCGRSTGLSSAVSGSLRRAEGSTRAGVAGHMPLWLSRYLNPTRSRRQKLLSLAIRDSSARHTALTDHRDDENCGRPRRPPHAGVDGLPALRRAGALPPASISLDRSSEAPSSSRRRPKGSRSRSW